ncbi:MAG: hypothetical protein HDS42_01090 [Bacteroides sp.]|nr:hypothetical protein [Bacteroides sp.]
MGNGSACWLSTLLSPVGAVVENPSGREMLLICRGAPPPLYISRSSVKGAVAMPKGISPEMLEVL